MNNNTENDLKIKRTLMMDDDDWKQENSAQLMGIIRITDDKKIDAIHNDKILTPQREDAQQIPPGNKRLMSI